MLNNTPKFVHMVARRPVENRPLPPTKPAILTVTKALMASSHKFLSHSNKNILSSMWVPPHSITYTSIFTIVFVHLAVQEAHKLCISNGSCRATNHYENIDPIRGPTLCSPYRASHNYVSISITNKFKALMFSLVIINTYIMQITLQ